MIPLLSKDDVERALASIKAEDAERKVRNARFQAWLEDQPDDIKSLDALAQRDVFLLMEMADGGADGLSR
jgi:hypothetical protein